MRELTRTNDPVRLSWLKALLADNDIVAFVFDGHAATLEGSINAISQRLMVANEDFDPACRILDQSGEDYAPVPNIKPR